MAALCVLEIFYRLPSWRKGGREEGGWVCGGGEWEGDVLILLLVHNNYNNLPLEAVYIGRFTRWSNLKFTSEIQNWLL